MRDEEGAYVLNEIEHLFFPAWIHRLPGWVRWLPAIVWGAMLICFLTVVLVCVGVSLGLWAGFCLMTGDESF